MFPKVIALFSQSLYLEKEVDVDQVGKGWEGQACNEVLPHVLLVSKGMAGRGGSV